VLDNLAALRRDFDIYTPDRGFRDSVNVDTGVVSQSYLALDQGMIMAAIGNALGGDFLRKLFVTPDFTQRLRPVIGVEEFANARSGQVPDIEIDKDAVSRKMRGRGGA
jgi:hypothetical protein